MMARPTAVLSAKARGEGYGHLLNNVTEMVGNTPCVRLSERTAPPGRTIYAKCEFTNPLSSVKDRLAVAIIEQAERDGTIAPGVSTIVEATSGNTGIAVAMVCAQRGYRCVIVMAEQFSVERRQLMRRLGARVVLTPAAQKATGMVQKAQELCAANTDWFLCRQFETDANWKFHEATTGPEIVNDFEGHRLDYWVTGYGTGGMYMYDRFCFSCDLSHCIGSLEHLLFHFMYMGCTDTIPYSCYQLLPNKPTMYNTISQQQQQQQQAPTTARENTLKSTDPT